MLSVVYSRTYCGRWYARGSAQLQNCKKEIRAKALKNKGYGLDVCASFPSLLSGLTTEVVRRRGATCSVDEIRAMVRDTKAWRAEVAKQLGVTAARVKKGVNALMFGKSSSNWKRSEGIPDHVRSPLLSRLEREIKEARVLIVDDEVKHGRATYGDKPTKTLSRAVEKVEEELMAMLISSLRRGGWETTSLIHDEVTIRDSFRFSNTNDEMQSLTATTNLSLRNFEDSRGWPPGSLRIEIQKL